MCLLVQHNNAGLRVSFSYIRKKPKCRNVEAAGSLKISTTPRDWTAQNADTPCTVYKIQKKKKRTCFLFRCRSTAKETNYNIYKAQQTNEQEKNKGRRPDTTKRFVGKISSPFHL